MRKFVLSTLLALLALGAFAQEPIARRNEKGLHIAHTVSSKETFYSLGRMYNVPPKDIAAFNNLEMERGLTVGQTVNVPLTAANFTQQKTTGHPVYYVVGEKEGLYRVSVNNNKVLMASLRKWNNLPSDAITAGQKLVVGYLVLPEGSAVAQNKPAPSKPTTPPPTESAPPTVKANDEKIPTEPAVTPQPERKPDTPRPVNASVNDGAGGYFRNDFAAQTRGRSLSKDEAATAGIFKTASGWQDAKYYALMDGVEPGTIIRVVNPTNNKAVYAKVLDKMTGIRQNQGYTVRISNAAATALDIADTDKFTVRVNY